MVFTFSTGPDYGLIKLLGDGIMGIPTQFVLKKNVAPFKGPGPSPQVIIYLGGVNKKRGTENALCAGMI